MLEYKITITPDPDASPAEVQRRAEFLVDYAARHIAKGGLFCDAIFTSAGRVQMHITPTEPKLPAEPVKAPVLRMPARIVGRKLVPARIVGRKLVPARIVGRKLVPFKEPSAETSILPRK